MTSTASETDISVLEQLDFDIELPCEIPQRRAVAQGTPVCDGGAAKWVGWRNNCCAASPRYLLLCDHCAQVYRAWMAAGAYISCADCGAEGGFIQIVPLNKRS